MGNRGVRRKVVVTRRYSAVERLRNTYDKGDGPYGTFEDKKEVVDRISSGGGLLGGSKGVKISLGH